MYIKFKRTNISKTGLLKGYMEKNNTKNSVLQWITTGVIVVSLIILYLLNGKYQADKIKNQYLDGKTVSTYIESGTDDTKRELQNLSYVRHVGEEKEVGNLLNGKYSYSTCVVLDQIAYEEMIKPTFVKQFGNYPLKKNEIMLSKDVLKYLGIENPVIGMNISLEFYWNNIFESEGVGKQNFILSGYYENYNNKIKAAPVSYISEAKIQNIEIESRYNRLLVDITRFGLSGEQIESKLINDLQLGEKQRIVSYDSASYKAIKETTGNFSFSFVFILIVFLSLFLIIYNVLYISFENDIKQYGLLRTIGMTNGQIKNLIYHQLWMIYWKSCVIGVISSILIVKICLNNVIQNIYSGPYKELNIFFVKSIVIVVLLVGIVLVLVSWFTIYKLIIITPIEATKFDISEKNLENKNLQLEFRGFPYNNVEIVIRLALYNVLRCKKKFVFAVMLICLGCEIALLGKMITSGTNQMNRLRANPDFSIEVSAEALSYLIENTYDEIILLTPEDIETIKNMIGFQTENFNITEVILPIIKDEFKTDSLEILDHDSIPVMEVIDNKDIDKILEYTTKNNIPIDKKTFTDKNGIIIFHENLIPQIYMKSVEQNIGETIEMYDRVPVGTNLQGLSVERFVTCGYLDITTSGVPNLSLVWKGVPKIHLMVSEKVFNNLSARMTPQIVKITFDVSNDKESISKQKLKDWVRCENLKIQSEKGLPDLELYSVRCNSEEIAKEYFYIKTSQVIMYTLSAILLLMGLVNFSTTMITNIFVRKRELAILESIGMTKKSINIMLIYEGLIYSGTIIGFLLSIGNIIIRVIAYIIKKRLDYFLFNYPIAMLVEIVIGMIIICTIIPKILIKIFIRENLVERMKTL